MNSAAEWTNAGEIATEIPTKATAIRIRSASNDLISYRFARVIFTGGLLHADAESAFIITYAAGCLSDVRAISKNQRPRDGWLWIRDARRPS